MLDKSGCFLSKWSGREDLNLRPPEPHSGALARLRHVPTGLKPNTIPAPCQATSKQYVDCGFRIANFGFSIRRDRRLVVRNQHVGAAFSRDLAVSTT